MSGFSFIQTAFRSIGLRDQATLTKTEIYNALDALCFRNAPQLGQFDRNVAEQLWEETPKVGANKIILKDFIQTILKGYSIVNIEIQAMEDQIKRQTNEGIKQQKIQELIYFVEDQKFLTDPFSWKPAKQRKSMPSLYPLHNSSKLNPNKLRGSRRSNTSESTVIFAKNHNDYSGRGSARDLVALFYITLICFCAQIFVMSDKHHFYNIMLYFSVFCIFLCNYFDKFYIRYILIFLGVTEIMDFLWLIIQTKEYWHPNFQSQHSVLQIGYAQFMVILILAMFFIKMIIGLLIFKYRSNPQTISKNIRLMGNNFPLDGFHNSPIASLLNKNINEVNPF